MNSRNALRAGFAGAILALIVLGLLWLVSVRQRQSASSGMAKEETLIGATETVARAAAVNRPWSGGQVSPVAALAGGEIQLWDLPVIQSRLQSSSFGLGRE